MFRFSDHMNLEEYLIKTLSEKGITLIGDGGAEYIFDEHTSRHPDRNFCFQSKNYGVVQFSYEKIKHWQLKKSPSL